MQGRLQQAQKMALGGSGFGGAGWGGRSWEAHSERTDLACVEEQRGRQKMWVHHEPAKSTTDRELVGWSWREGEKWLEKDLKDKYWDKQIQLSFDRWVHDFLLVQVQPAVAQTAEDLLGPRQTWLRKEWSGRLSL